MNLKDLHTGWLLQSGRYRCDGTWSPLTARGHAVLTKTLKRGSSLHCFLGLYVVDELYTPPFIRAAILSHLIHGTMLHFVHFISADSSICCAVCLRGLFRLMCHGLIPQTGSSILIQLERTENKKALWVRSQARAEIRFTQKKKETDFNTGGGAQVKPIRAGQPMVVEKVVKIRKIYEAPLTRAPDSHYINITSHIMRRFVHVNLQGDVWTH